MNPTIDMERLNLNIQIARQAVEELRRLGEDFPSVARNAERILASLKMLEINISDLLDYGSVRPPAPLAPAGFLRPGKEGG